jgi:hypothetical protein
MLETHEWSGNDLLFSHQQQLPTMACSPVDTGHGAARGKLVCHFDSINVGMRA